MCVLSIWLQDCRSALLRYDQYWLAGLVQKLISSLIDFRSGSCQEQELACKGTGDKHGNLTRLLWHAQAYPEKNDPSICNQNVPNDSVYHRFLYILQVGFPPCALAEKLSAHHEDLPKHEEATHVAKQEKL